MTPATDKSKKKWQTAEETTDKSKKKGQTEEEKKEIFDNLLEKEMIQDTINADKEKKSTGRKKRLRKIMLVVGRNSRKVLKTKG